jgi:hypothetical protein
MAHQMSKKNTIIEKVHYNKIFRNMNKILKMLFNNIKRKYIYFNKYKKPQDLTG